MPLLIMFEERRKHRDRGHHKRHGPKQHYRMPTQQHRNRQPERHRESGQVSCVYIQGVEAFWSIGGVQLCWRALGRSSQAVLSILGRGGLVDPLFFLIPKHLVWSHCCSGCRVRYSAQGSWNYPLLHQPFYFLSFLE